MVLGLKTTVRSVQKCFLIFVIHTKLNLICPLFIGIRHEQYSWCSTYGPHLTISVIFFLFVWIKYFTFYISKRTVSMLSISCIILQIWFSGTIFTRTFQYFTGTFQYGLRVPFWNQNLHFRFTCFYLFALLNGSFFFYRLKTSIK